MDIRLDGMRYRSANVKFLDTCLPTRLVPLWQRSAAHQPG